MSRILNRFISLLAVTLWVFASQMCMAADQRPPGARIQLQPPRLTALARALQDADPTTQWEFADIVLEAMLHSYDAELSDAARERLSTPARRNKLARWRQATAGVATQLEQARLRLSQGTPFVLHVDAQQQLFIIIDGQPVAVTAPRPEAERDVEERVLAAFCRFNDCSVVNDQGTSRSPDKRDLVGAWLLSQQAPPTFEVDDVLRCEFTDLMRREDKAAACRETAGELVELDQAIRTAADRGYRIDWEILAAHPPSSGGGGQVVVNAAGAFLEARTSMLARLPETDWRNLVEWLRRAPLDKQAPVTLHRAEHMIADR